MIIGGGGGGLSVDLRFYREFTGDLYGFIGKRSGKVYRPQLLCGMLCGPFIGGFIVYRESAVSGGNGSVHCCAPAPLPSIAFAKGTDASLLKPGPSVEKPRRKESIEERRRVEK